MNTAPATAHMWRLRAQQSRELSEQMWTPQTRDNLRRLADEYESMARSAEERARLLAGRVSTG